jgi:prepilin-type N-terminal cleavage/methylation domain-containing protein
MNKTSPALVQGFTLIEMTVVLLLITLLASVAIRETNSLSFQVRYEQTQERLERIREAILGNPRQIINGQQAVSGFVADMGRLPNNLRELVDQNYCTADRTIDETTSANAVADCNSLAADAWKTQPSWQTDADTGLGFGWRGPYLNISGSVVDKDAFVDGWGRMAQGYCSNIIHMNEAACVNPAGWTPPIKDNNYGWYYAISTNDLRVKSYGKNHISGGSDYDADYPAPASQPEVKSQDWLVDISGGININLLKKYGTDSYCGFLSTSTYTNERDCLNAGGAWSGSCSLTVSSCKSVGGRWQSCFFSPSACASAGGTSTGQCQFTQKNCNAITGFAWSTNQCTANDNIQCANAGGTWNDPQCDFSPQQCSNAGGTWVNDCTFTDANCIAAGGTLEDTSLPHSCSFTQTACYTKHGQSTNSDCYMSHAEFTGAKYTVGGCQAASGSWTAKLCMNLFYRDPDTSAITYVPSLPVTIDENGGYQTVQFLFPDTADADEDGITNEPIPVPLYVPIGQNAIGIYEYDGDGDYCDLNNPLYPADRQNPIQVDFHPRTGLPVINW